MNQLIKAPFTEEQVKMLNAHQQDWRFHPYTCDRKAIECEVNLRPRDYTKDGVLKATPKGWVCPCGEYKQDWA